MSKRLWTEVEMEMVLYFYLKNREFISTLEKENDDFIDLVKRINYISGNNRTKDSIYMRIQNYKYVDPIYNGKGLSGGADLCKIYWDKYIDNQDILEKRFKRFVEISNQSENEFYNVNITISAGCRFHSYLNLKIFLAFSE